jgi:hypothetical protein
VGWIALSMHLDLGQSPNNDSRLAVLLSEASRPDSLPVAPGLLSEGIREFAD